jgi:hypothetical protein
MEAASTSDARNYLFPNSRIISKLGQLTRSQVDDVITEYVQSPEGFRQKYKTGEALKFMIDLGQNEVIPALPIVTVCLMKYFGNDFEGIGPGTFRGEASTVKEPLEKLDFHIVAKDEAGVNTSSNQIQTSIIEVLKMQEHYRSTGSAEMETRGRALDALGTQLRSNFKENSVASSIQASNGAGNYAMVPWVRLFDQKLSPNARTGWYIVLLFAKSGESVYVSLNQGTSELSRQEVANRTKRAREDRLQIEVSELISRGFTTEIELGAGGLADGYVAGNVVSKSYGIDEVPNDVSILQDIEALVPLLKKLYEQEILVESSWNSEGEIVLSDPNLEALCAEIYWNPSEALDLIGGLTDGSPQIILTGPPGTGKTWVASKIAKYILAQEGGISYADVDDSAVRLVQFHPSYGYEDFVEGLRPVPKGNGFEFIEHPGIIRQMAQAAESGSPQILIIDEVNRANIPRVFGELMYLLEYRDERIHLQYGGEFKLPKNIYIIGTMNNADRSVRTIDLALRRRFDFFELAPNMQVLEAFYKSRRNELNEKLWTGLQKLNERIENELGVRHLAIGHSYFMKSDGMDKTQLSKIWKQQIFPLIEDYFYDQPEIAKSFRLQDFWE